MNYLEFLVDDYAFLYITLAKLLPRLCDDFIIPVGLSSSSSLSSLYTAIEGTLSISRIDE